MMELRPRFAKTPLRERVFEALLFSLPVLLTGIAFQYSCLSSGGLEVIQGALGMSQLSKLTYLQCFAGEVLEASLLVPAMLLLVAWFAPPRMRKWIYFALAELALLVSAISWATYHSISQFPSADLAMDLWATFRTNPGFVTPGALMSTRVEGAFVAVLLSGLVPLFLLRWRPLRDIAPRYAGAVLCTVLVIGGTAGLLRASGRATAALYRMGNLERTVVELFRSDAVEAGFYRATADTPKRDYDNVIFPDGRPPSHPVKLWGESQPRAPNLVLVVLETAGSCDYSFSGPGSHMPHVASLVPHSLIALKHYTTDPESIRANFSIYTSLYELPGRGRQQFFMKQLGGSGAERPDALPRILKERGYATHYYFPYNLWPKNFEEDTLHSLGFDRIRLGLDAPADPDWNRELNTWNRTVLFGSPANKMAAERAMYRMAFEDMAKFHAEGRPFFVALAASIGHAPFTDLRPVELVVSRPHPTRAELLNNLAAFQDDLIGMLIQKLVDFDLMGNTILVITGDHGPRTLLEDPALNLFYSSDETYHVPLLIHYPAAFKTTFEVKGITSHVDLAPTILDLMGIDRSAYLHQGLSMFDDAIDNRITFFFGEHLLGTDALQYHGQFFMFSHTTETAYISERFAFSPRNLIRDASGGPVRKYREALNQMRRVQWEWIWHWRRAEQPVHPVRATSGIP
jgi:arylsulfatase A-like enzyme